MNTMNVGDVPIETHFRVVYQLPRLSTGVCSRGKRRTRNPSGALYKRMSQSCVRYRRSVGQ